MSVSVTFSSTHWMPFLQFSTSVQENRRGDGECLVSANLGGQCIFIFDTRSAEENVEIAFDEENGRY